MLPSRLTSETVTIRQIAQRAGCSTSVVSTVLNDARGNTRVSEELRQRVEWCAYELNYTPNYHARALRSGRSFTVGLLYGVDAMTSTQARFFSTILEGVQRTVRAAGSDVLIVGPAQMESDLERGVRYYRQGRLDALILPGMIYESVMDQVADADAPIVVALPFTASRHPTVTVDLVPGLREAMRHLFSFGHRRLMWVGPEVEVVIGEPQARARAVEAAAAEAGLAIQSVLVPADGLEHQRSPDDWIENTRCFLAQRLGAEQLPTAFVAYNELTGLGTYAALAQAGFRVPEDVSVIGFGDLVAELALPPMSVVSLRLRDVGAAAAELAMEMAGDPAARSRLEGHVTSLPAHMVMHRSTGPACDVS